MYVVNNLAVSQTKINLFSDKHLIPWSQYSPRNNYTNWQVNRVCQQILKPNLRQNPVAKISRLSKLCWWICTYLNNIVKPLHDRLRKNPPPWSDIHTQVVKEIKFKVQSIKCLYLPILQAFKIFKIDASDKGYGGILKHRVNTRENIIAYTSKHWNSAQQKYSTVKKKF